MVRKVKLQVNDKTVYVDLDGSLLHGTVESVVKWTFKKGFTYYVRHDNGALGEFRWTDRHIFKEGAKIPRRILEEHLTCSEDSDD